MPLLNYMVCVTASVHIRLFAYVHSPLVKFETATPRLQTVAIDVVQS